MSSRVSDWTKATAARLTVWHLVYSSDPGSCYMISRRSHATDKLVRTKRQVVLTGIQKSSKVYCANAIETGIIASPYAYELCMRRKESTRTWFQVPRDADPEEEVVQRVGSVLAGVRSWEVP
jgi:hypothetical protein